MGGASLLKRALRDLPYAIMCVIFWCILNEKANLIIILSGLLLGFFSITMGRLLLGYPLQSKKINIKSMRLFIYMIRLIINIYKASLRGIWLIIKGQDQVHMMTKKVNLNEDWQKILLANSITLTPGTIAVDYIGETLLVLTNEEDLKGAEQEKNIIEEQIKRTLTD